ncbi:uncharacterized protein LOC130357556 [Hyla sarda]|uniref:uncharacterized protein LOC130357556 n=1 Tax=Hyla sarda TaxID=327740 RepID=UPI0024C3E2C3|nr:uncharacterized protein LOC130357556 [Hyla sarda]
MSDDQLSPPNGGLTHSSQDHILAPSELLQQMVSTSVQSALASAMSSVNDSISKYVSMALSRQHREGPASSDTPLVASHIQSQASSLLRPGKSDRKRRYCSDLDTHLTNTPTIGGGSKLTKTSVPPEDTTVSAQNPTDGDDMPGGTSRSSRRNKPDSFVEDSDGTSDSGDDDLYEFEDEDLEGNASRSPPHSSADTSAPRAILDSMGIPFFSPENIKHPRSGEWTPMSQVADYVSAWLRKSLDSRNRNKLRAECPRPSLSNNVAMTPELDPILVRYLVKTSKNPKKGIDKSFKAVQDKLLDVLGPMTKILQLAEHAVASGEVIDADILRGWALRAVCLLGNANTAASTERRRSILMRLDPQLTHLATDEPGPPADGLLFGEAFLKNINKYVGLFSGLDKAQSSLKKVGANKVFPRAGRGRGRPSGRATNYRPYNRGHYMPDRQYYAPVPQPPQPSTPFFPPRGRPWRARGASRGYPRSRGTGY